MKMHPNGERTLLPAAKAVKKENQPATPPVVTVPVTMPLELYRRILAMGAYDERADFSETVVSSMEGDIAAWLETGDENPTPSEYLEKFERELDAAPNLTRKPQSKPRVVTLRPAADATLELLCRGYNLTPEIVVQVCAEYWLNHDTLTDKLNRDGLVADVRAVQRANRRKKRPTLERVPGRIVVELDDRASAMLRAQMAGTIKNGCLEPGGDPRDLASASVLFMLDTTDDGTSTQEWLEQAHARRESLEGKEGH